MLRSEPCLIGRLPAMAWSSAPAQIPIRWIGRICSRPPGQTALQQQASSDGFIREFNGERPHEALQMKVPDEGYRPSTRPYNALPELAYPFHDRAITVTACGCICMQRKKINLSMVMAGQTLATKEVEDGIRLNRKPCKPSTIRSARDCHPCLRNNLLPMSQERTL